MSFETQLRALVDEARATKSSALVILKDGEVLLDEAFDGQGARPIEIMSVTKGVLSLIVGRAVTLGLLPGPDVKVSEYFPEWRQGKKRDITLRQLMTHTSGLQNLPTTGPEIYPSPDFVQLALCAELDSEPGQRFAYNNKAANLICGVLERATGQKADDFARDELFKPLGITDFIWMRDQAGNPHGMAGLSLQASDLARLGELARLKGENLISADWMQESTSPATPVLNELGLSWWLLFAWRKIQVSEQHVQNIAQAGAPQGNQDALRSAIGTWDSFSDFNKHLTERGYERGRIPQDTLWVDEIIGPQVGFTHSGDLGQYLIVLPEAGLVAVRQIEDTQAGHPNSGFPEFTQRVMALADVFSQASHP